jgi:hypothetical protein
MQKCVTLSVTQAKFVDCVNISSDEFTKNVGGQDFYGHRDKYVRDNPSIQRVGATTTNVPVGEGGGVRVHLRDAGAEQMQRTGSFVGESLICVGEGVNGGVSDPDDTGEEHVGSVVAAREEG